MRRSLIAILTVFFLFSVTSIWPSLPGKSEKNAESTSSLAKKRIELFKANIRKALAARDKLPLSEESILRDDLFIRATVNPEEAGRRIKKWMSTNKVVELSDAIDAIDSALLLDEQFARKVILAVSQKKFQRGGKSISCHFASFSRASELEPEACFRIFNAITEQKPGISDSLYKFWETGFAKKDVEMAEEAAKKAYPQGLPKNYRLSLATGMAQQGNLAEACAIVRKYSSDSDDLSELLSCISKKLRENPDEFDHIVEELENTPIKIPENYRINFWWQLARTLRDKDRNKAIEYYRKSYSLAEGDQKKQVAAEWASIDTSKTVEFITKFPDMPLNPQLLRAALQVKVGDDLLSALIKNCEVEGSCLLYETFAEPIEFDPEMAGKMFNWADESGKIEYSELRFSNLCSRMAGLLPKESKIREAFAAKIAEIISVDPMGKESPGIQNIGRILPALYAMDENRAKAAAKKFVENYNKPRPWPFILVKRIAFCVATVDEESAKVLLEGVKLSQLRENRDAPLVVRFGLLAELDKTARDKMITRAISFFSSLEKEKPGPCVTHIIASWAEYFPEDAFDYLEKNYDRSKCLDVYRHILEGYSLASTSREKINPGICRRIWESVRNSAIKDQQFWFKLAALSSSTAPEITILAADRVFFDKPFCADSSYLSIAYMNLEPDRRREMRAGFYKKLAKVAGGGPDCAKCVMIFEIRRIALECLDDEDIALLCSQVYAAMRDKKLTVDGRFFWIWALFDFNKAERAFRKYNPDINRRQLGMQYKSIARAGLKDIASLEEKINSQE